MSDKIRRLSDVKVAGRDYPAKVKIDELLDHEVLLTNFDHVVIMKDVKLPDGTKAEVEDANYYNVTVEDGEIIKTFSTGATQIINILQSLTKEDLPLLCEFSKEGRSYVVR
jgi:hypothetical protein